MPNNYLTRPVLTVLLFLYSLSGYATGWHDYDLEIGDGYSIFRANTFDISLSRNNEIIVSRHDFNQIGPIVGYFKNPSHILLKASGWKSRNLFPGDDFKEIDFSKTHYFVVRTEDGKVDGPMAEEAFGKDRTVVALGKFEWVKPKNPNFWLPLFGTLFFISLSIPILYIKYWYVSVPATILTVYWLMGWRKASVVRRAR